MDGPEVLSTSPLMAMSNALVALHKEQFGRGPTKARTYYAGPDALVCVLEDVLLPAEHKLLALGDGGRVRDARSALQAATEEEFVQSIERISGRKVRAFASALDPDANVVFENFVFVAEAEPSADGGAPPVT